MSVVIDGIKVIGKNLDSLQHVVFSSIKSLQIAVKMNLVLVKDDKIIDPVSGEVDDWLRRHFVVR